jgi:nicotinamidase-related amidase
MDIDIFKTKLRRVLDFFRPEVQAETKIKLDIAKGDAALLVIDVQKEFADPAQGRGNRETEQVTHRINSLIPAFRAAGLPAYVVYFSDFERKPEDIDFYIFRPIPEDKLIAKDHDSAFRGSEIKKILKADKRKTLITCGFNLNACVFKTVMDARDHGFEVVLLRDLTGNDNDNDRSKTEEHLEKMKKRGVRFVRSLDLLEDISDFKKDTPLPQQRGPRPPSA